MVLLVGNLLEDVSRKKFARYPDQGWRSRGQASVSRPASRPNFNGLGLGHDLGCPCLGLGLGLGGPGLDYNPGVNLPEQSM